jgi:hypothetical protein
MGAVIRGMLAHSLDDRVETFWETSPAQPTQVHQPTCVINRDALHTTIVVALPNWQS